MYTLESFNTKDDILHDYNNSGYHIKEIFGRKFSVFALLLQIMNVLPTSILPIGKYNGSNIQYDLIYTRASEDFLHKA